MRILKGDQVKVIAGKFKGTVGAVTSVDTKNRKVIIADVNVRRKHVKPTQDNPEGGIVEKEFPIDISNVMYVIKDGKKETTTRIRYKRDPKNKKKKIRIAVKTGEEV